MIGWKKDDSASLHKQGLTEFSGFLSGCSSSKQISPGKRTEKSHQTSQGIGAFFWLRNHNVQSFLVYKQTMAKGWQQPSIATYSGSNLSPACPSAFRLGTRIKFCTQRDISSFLILLWVKEISGQKIQDGRKCWKNCSGFGHRWKKSTWPLSVSGMWHTIIRLLATERKWCAGEMMRMRVFKISF